jgi:hypothetical protein
MRVTTRPIDAPVALLETPRRDGQGCQRVLIFQEGLLAAPVVALLARLLERI